MKTLWLTVTKLVALAIFVFLWFGVLVPFCINTPDDLWAALGFIIQPFGVLVGISLFWLMFKAPLVRWYKKVKEVFF